jgi:arsenite methyltransferase
MTSYLDEKFDLTDPNLVSVYDEFPIWSSYFGTSLLDMVDYKPNTTALDIGCGAGFPLIELAQRLGPSSTVFGIDTWTSAYERINLKLRTMKIKNVVFLNQPAESLPFKDNTFDLIVSNNGINNVQDPQKVLAECFRTLKKDAQFLMSVNLPGTMIGFYNVFKEVLNHHNLSEEIKKIDEHIRSKRKTLDETLQMLKESKLNVSQSAEDSFSMRYADGTAFLNHYFIKLAFLDSWKNIVDKENMKKIFSEVEEHLNKMAAESGHLKLTVPFVVIKCYK